MAEQGRIGWTPALLAGLILLASCAAPRGPATVGELAQPPSRELRLHIVSPQETLYSIAFRYEKDMRELARINGIAPPYLIYPGQRIYLLAEAAPAPRSVAASTGSSPAQPAPRQQPAPSPSQGGAAASGSAPADTAPTRTLEQSQRVASAVLPTQVSNWAWPNQGRVVQAFGRGDPPSRGISIGGTAGDPVSAAAAGVVVYSGAGLRGYGNLLIVKHSELFLSAYAHNSELLVREGDSVRQGQVIARMGTNPEGRAALYFEIREDGNPVDPIRFLPRRG